MKYLHTMVRVENLEASLHFYCTLLGFQEIQRVDNPDAGFSLIFLAAAHDAAAAHTAQAPFQTPTLELTYNWPAADGASETYTGGRNFGHLAYAVDDIYATCQHLLDHGVTLHRPPRDGYMAFIKSPDGISIELLQDGDPLPPQEPWSSMENTGTW